ncbi:MAG: M67 family metallopeptidase [Deltaproteobacteria bacterium]|jgi:[CysO sulfur-carrier protein]-S-L-cysteine hydrolase|nr:M67 family metallopeptidase [Deltaproteobacteria bacterium]MBT4265134.1 M67 family metallopeptidase [Deltaproteobacteria bacterium]MBT4642101.1 M67 family metallopeptidase [Deltaproteobacteria bacterium]MBT6499482.1 M67 family metallopeptidase [Deltaproteobacteria bacterium]MBT6615051.1 M67 family metallopeptidase [Deltaproteobacteria bacterium]
MKISKAIVAEILKQAQTEAPIESCGYLAGNNNQVHKFFRMKNVDQSPEHYSFDPQEQFKILMEAREKKLDLIAVYHSHPQTPARPSKEDIRLAYDSQISYVIISLINDPPDIKSFKIKGGIVNPEVLEII